MKITSKMKHSNKYIWQKWEYKLEDKNLTIDFKLERQGEYLVLCWLGNHSLMEGSRKFQDKFKDSCISIHTIQHICTASKFPMKVARSIQMQVNTLELKRSLFSVLIQNWTDCPPPTNVHHLPVPSFFYNYF